MKATVLDASALLAMFFGEPGMEKMRELFHKAAEADRPVFISSVNWAEVVYRMHGKKGDIGLEIIRQFERTMPLDVVAPDREMAETAALVKSKHGLGLADAFAAALAQIKKAELVTGDNEFRPLAKEIEIVWLRK